MKSYSKKGVISLVVILIIGLLLSACSSNHQSSGKSRQAGKSKGSQTATKQVLNLYSGTDFTSLDPAHASDAPSFDGLYAIRSGLMTFNDDGDPIPDMAAEMPKVNKDKTVYTFKLRNDAKWSNGDPVTAHDFVYAWQRELKPDTAGEYSYIYGSARIKNASKILDKNSDLYGKVDQLGIKALDDHTLQVTLDKPTPYFVSLMTFPPFFPLNQKFVEKQGDQFASSPDKMLFNGPFVLAKWQRDQGWVYKKNNQYWDKNNVKLDQVNYKVVKQTPTAIQLYQTNKLDYVKLDTEYITQFENSKELHKGNLTANSEFIRLNEKNKALANKNIRLALYNAFDRSQMTKMLMKDGSAPARYNVPKDFTKSPEGTDFRAANPEISKMSVQQAQKLFKKGLKQLGTDQITIKLMYHEGTLDDKRSVYIQSQLEKNLPGLTVKLEKETYNQHLKLEGAMKYDMSLWGWLPDYKDPMTYLDMWVTDGPFNRTGYANPKYDAMIKKANNLGADPEKRWKVMQEAEKLLLEDAVIIPTDQKANAYVKKPYVNHLIIRNYGPTVDFKHAYIAKH